MTDAKATGVGNPCHRATPFGRLHPRNPDYSAVRWITRRHGLATVISSQRPRRSEWCPVPALQSDRARLRYSGTARRWWHRAGQPAGVECRLNPGDFTASEACFAPYRPSGWSAPMIAGISLMPIWSHGGGAGQLSVSASTDRPCARSPDAVQRCATHAVGQHVIEAMWRR